MKQIRDYGHQKDKPDVDDLIFGSDKETSSK